MTRTEPRGPARVVDEVGARDSQPDHRPVSTAVCRIAVRLTPRAAEDRVEGVVNGVLRVRVAAPPVDGAANRALLRLLAAELHAPKRDLRLIGGEGGRGKLVAVDGPAAEAVRARWPDLRR